MSIPSREAFEPLPTNGEPALLEDLLKLAALAELAVEDGKITSAGLIEAERSVGRDVDCEDLVAHRLQPVDDRLAADQADFALGAGAAVENGDFS